MQIDLESIITSERVPYNELPPGVLKGNALLDVSSYLFKYILSDSDPRWDIVSGFVQARQETRFNKQHFENALTAIYLSRTPSFRNRYGHYPTEENLRQLCRAVRNVGAFPLLIELFNNSEEAIKLPDGVSIKLARSNRIQSGTDRQGITGCPEALYQLRMFGQKGYAARVGFNVHAENDATVLSITNIQGVPVGISYQELYRQCAGRPFNFLLRRVIALAEVNPNPTLIRGLKNPTHTESSGLYNATLKTEGIQRLSFNRNYSV